jgi:hypothetical protein
MYTHCPAAILFDCLAVRYAGLDIHVTSIMSREHRITRRTLRFGSTLKMTLDNHNKARAHFLSPQHFLSPLNILRLITIPCIKGRQNVPAESITQLSTMER